MKHILTLSDLSKTNLQDVFKRADSIKTKRLARKSYQPLRGMTLGMVFEKASTRTRISFEVGMNLLGGHPLFLDSENLQIGRGETIEDSAKIFSLYLDAILIRTFDQETVEELARHSSIPIINGLTDLHHPCQIISDLYTIKKRLGKLKGVKIVYIGDGNNMLNSLMEGCSLFGMDLAYATPKGYDPDTAILEQSLPIAKKSGGTITSFRKPSEAAAGADVLYTDVWVSMGQEGEQKKRKKAFKDFQINTQLLRHAKKKALVMHCLPAHRGEEITDEVMQGKQSIVFEQAENRLYVQMAMLDLLIGEKGWRKKN